MDTSNFVDWTQIALVALNVIQTVALAFVARCVGTDKGNLR